MDNIKNTTIMSSSCTNFEDKLNEALKQGKSLVQIKELLKNQNTSQDNQFLNKTNQINKEDHVKEQISKMDIV